MKKLLYDLPSQTARNPGTPRPDETKIQKLKVESRVVGGLNFEVERSRKEWDKTCFMDE